LHRDIKPGNILFTNTGQVKVADFGIAKTPDADHTATGMILGTLPYLSPDRLAGAPATVGDDLYALGVVGYEALTARKPFAREHPAATARAIVEDRPTALTDMRPDVDPALVSVIERAMSRDPAQRFASARDMRAAMPTAPSQAPPPIPAPAPTRLLTAGPPATLPPDASTHRIGPAAPPTMNGRGRTRLVPWLMVALAAAVVIAIAIAVAAIGQDDSAPPNTGTADTTLPGPVSSVTQPAGPALTGVPPPPPVSPPAKQPNGNGNGKNKEKDKEGGGNSGG
jgi:serine/threonine-protein kinase